MNLKFEEIATPFGSGLIMAQFFEVEAVEVVAVEDNAAEDHTHSRPEVPFAVPFAGQHGGEGQFKARCKCVYWTLSGLKEDWFTKEDIFKQLSDKCPGGVYELIVGKERHPNPKDPEKCWHFHAMVHANEPFDTLRWPAFAVYSSVTQRDHLAHVQHAKLTKLDRQCMVEYTREEGDTIAKLVGDVEYPARKKKTWAVAMKEAKSVSEALEWLWENDPARALTHGTTIKRNLELFMPIVLKPQFEATDFNITLNLNKAVVLHGAANAGKTQLALAQGANPLLVTQVDDLGALRPGFHSHVVFDDMSFGQGGLGWNAEQIISLLDMDETRSIKCRYFNARIPAGMPRIFTTNKSMDYPFSHIFPAGINAHQLEAIRRRYITIEVTERLWAE